MFDDSTCQIILDIEFYPVEIYLSFPYISPTRTYHSKQDASETAPKYNMQEKLFQNSQSTKFPKSLKIEVRVYCFFFQGKN